MILISQEIVFTSNVNFYSINILTFHIEYRFLYNLFSISLRGSIKNSVFLLCLSANM
jgi:hypothetical protein